MKLQVTLLAALFVLLVIVLPSVYAQEETCPAGTYPVTHALGLTCVPENVERVITLENSLTEAVVTLGVQPVGAADIALYRSLVNIPTPLADDVVDVGSRREPNLEVIASLDPDVIIAASFRVADNYEELNAIAPTLAFEGSTDLQTMSGFFTTIADVLGREAEAEQILEDMHAYFDAAHTALEGTDVNERFVLSQTWYEDSVATFRLFTDNAMPIEILTTLGLENAWDAEAEPDGFSVVDIEALGAISDANFFFITDADSASFYEESPLWNSLPFVAEGSAYRLNDDLWLFGGPLSAQRFVDAVLGALGVEVIPVGAECEDGQRAVIDAAGESVCIPENPQRIVGLLEADVDALLALGIIPAGSTNGRGQMTPPRYLSGYLGDVPSMGQFYSPNLEVLLTLQPDLILFGGFTDEAVLEQLNAIAPTVNTLKQGESWQEHFLRVAAILNMTEEAEAFIDGYEARLEEVRGKLGDDTDAVFIVARWSADCPQIMAPTLTFSSRVLLDLGLLPAPEIPELQEGHPHSAPLSLESLKLLDVDWAFIGTLSPEGDAVTALDEALNNPLFQSLGVVQNGGVVQIDGSLWTSVGGPLAAMLVLDDVEAALTGGE